MSQVLIWSLIAFYIALAVVIVLKGAAIAQVMYDLAQKLSHMKYGWLLIIGFMSALFLHYSNRSRRGLSDPMVQFQS